MSSVVADIEPVGDRSEGVGEFFQGSDPGGGVVRGRDVSTDPQDGAGPEHFSTKGRAAAH